MRGAVEIYRTTGESSRRRARCAQGTRAIARVFAKSFRYVCCRRGDRRRSAMTRITRVLVPTDFSATADAALDYAYGLAERFGASIELLHVLDDPFVVDGMAAEAYISEGPALRTAMLQEAQERLRHRAAPRTGIPSVTSEVLFGHGARTIAEYAADRGVDLIVMGTHGRTGFAH